MSAEQSTLVLPWVQAATSGFVNAHEMREALSLAMAAGLNLIFSGPGGHGKSEFLTSAIGAITDTEPYIKSFGQGTSSEELYGGLDLDALNRQGGEEKAVIQYSPELSFLARRIAVFEELFDAPPRVLTSLKDTLTARELRNGHQRFPMATRVIAAATNHSPQEIAEGGPEIAALIERFPVQLEVKWDSYDENSFVELFAAVTGPASTIEKITWNDVATLQERTKDAVISRSMQRLLARIIVELRNDKVVISPRTAVLAMQLAKAAAAINGRTRVTPYDISAIAYLPGAHTLKSRIASLIAEFSVSMAGEEELDNLEDVFGEARLMVADTKEQLRGLVQILDEIADKAQVLVLDTYQTGRRRNLLHEIAAFKVPVQRKLEGLLREENREVHRQILNRFTDEIRRLANKVRHAKATGDLDEAAFRLEEVKADLRSMVLHPDLEPKRNELMMKIQLAGMN